MDVSNRVAMQLGQLTIALAEKEVLIETLQAQIKALEDELNRAKAAAE